MISHISTRQTAARPLGCRHRQTVHPNVACAAGSSKSQQGWHWPFSKHTADDGETEIVYVTDTAEADEIIEEPEYDDVDQAGQQQLQPHASLDAAAAAQAAVATEDDQLQPEYDSQQEGVPEALASTASTHSISHQQLDQLQHQQQHPQQQHPQQEHSTPVAAASQSVSPRPAFASSSLAAPVSSSYWSNSAGGWVVALSLLFAVRQGRQHADAARLDVRALQARQQDSRVQGRELREKRAQYLQQQQLLKEEAAAKRLAEQAREAERLRRESAVKAAQYERTAKEELDILLAKRAAAKKVFEESQGKLDEELAARTAREIAIREEAEAKKAAEEADRRAAAAAAAARAAAEAAAATEAAERAAREAAAARAAMKQQLRANSITYRLNLCGTAVAAPLQSTGSRQPQLSVKLSIWPDTGAGVVEPAPIAQLDQLYDSSDSATEGAAALAIQVAQQVYTHYVPAATEGIVDLEGLEVQRQGASSTQLQQQQEVDGQQLLQGGSSSSSGSSGVHLGEGDVVLWRLLLLGRLEAAGRQAVGQVAPLAASGELQQDLKAAVSYSALTQSDPNSLQQRLQQCADLSAQQQLPAAIQLLDDIIEWQLEDFIGADLSSLSNNSSSLSDVLQQVVSTGLAAGCPASPYLVPACVYAVLLNLFDPATQAINRKTASSRAATAVSTSGAVAADGSAVIPNSSTPSSPDSTALDDDDMFDAAGDPSSSSSTAALPPSLSRRSIVSDIDSPLQRLVKFQLEQLEKAAPADQLAPVAVCLRLLLGRRHPVAAAMQLLGERNMSAGARQARALRRQQRQLAMATELLKDSQLAGGQRQQMVPAPERIWALRNVASSMLRSTASSGGGGSSSSSTPSAEEAVSMLRQASNLAAEHYGANHPGRLSSLLDYVGALRVVPGHAAEAKTAIEAVCSIVAAVGERYRQQKDLLSLVLLYESTQAELDVPEVIGRECVAMTRLQRQAADAFGVLETAQANLVMSKRKLPAGSPRTALRQLASDCTEQLGSVVYAAVKKRDTRLDQWNKGLPLAPLK